MKKLVTLLLVVSMLLGLAAGAVAEAPQKTKIIVGCRNNITSLTPFITPNPFINAICGELYMYLAERESCDSPQMTGALAKSWEQVDGKTYNFELYDTIVDSAGNKFTSSDVKFCFEKAVLSGVAAASYVESIEVLDDTHFVMHLTSESVGTLEQVCENVFMVTQASYEASPDGMATTPVGTTQYVLRNYVPGSTITLEKTDSYWQTEELTSPNYKANVDVIQYDFLTENTQMNLALMQGDIQMALEVNNSLVADLMQNENYNVGVAPLGIYRLLVFNMTENSPFANNKALREAVCYAIDADALRVGAASGFAETPNGLGVSKYIGYDSAWEGEPGSYYGYNPEKAKELLAEAGYKPNQLTLRLGCNALTIVKTYFEMIAAYLNNIGIKTEIVTYESTVYGEKQLNVTANEWDMILNYSITSIYQANQWAAMFDNDVYAHGLTQGGLDSPELQQLVDDCLAPDWTPEKLNELHDYITDNCLAYEFIHENKYFCANKAITDIFYGGKGELRVGSCTFAEDYNYFE